MTRKRREKPDGLTWDTALLRFVSLSLVKVPLAELRCQIFTCGCSQQNSRTKPESSPGEEEDGDIGEEEEEMRGGSPASRRSEEGGPQQTSSPASHHSSPQGRRPQTQ